MIELQLLLEHNGSKVRVYDNLVFVEQAYWKLDQFRMAIGERLVEGEKVQIEAEDLIDRRGRCHVYIDTFEGRNRNKIESYLPPTASRSSGAATSQNPATPPPSGKGIQLNEFGEPSDIDF